MAILTLLFAYTIEVLQLIDILGYLNIKKTRLTNLLLGSTFDYKDLISYTLGILTVLGVEKLKK